MNVDNMQVRSQAIDISGHQSPSSIDWKRVLAEGVSMAWLKVLEGQTSEDKSWREHLQRATDAGVPCGGYLYLHPSGNVVDSANRFCDLAQSAGFRLPPMLDLETRCGQPAKGADAGCKAHPKAPAERVVEATVTWNTVVEMRWRKPLLYWGRGFAEELRRDGAPLAPLAKWDQWLASYNPTLLLIDGQPEPILHQHTDGGATGPLLLTAGLQLDRNRCRVTAAEMEAYGVAVEPDPSIDPDLLRAVQFASLQDTTTRTGEEDRAAREKRVSEAEDES